MLAVLNVCLSVVVGFVAVWAGMLGLARRSRRRGPYEQRGLHALRAAADVTDPPQMPGAERDIRDRPSGRETEKGVGVPQIHSSILDTPGRSQARFDAPGGAGLMLLAQPTSGASRTRPARALSRKSCSSCAPTARARACCGRGEILDGFGRSVFCSERRA